MSKEKIVPIFGASADPQYHEAEVQVNAHTYMKMAKAERVQADIALHFSPQLAEARAELESRRQLVEDQVRRYQEAENAATALGIGKGGPPVNPKTVFVVMAASFLFELVMSSLAFSAISF